MMKEPHLEWHAVIHLIEWPYVMDCFPRTACAIVFYSLLDNLLKYLMHSGPEGTFFQPFLHSIRSAAWSPFCTCTLFTAFLIVTCFNPSISETTSEMGPVSRPRKCAPYIFFFLPKIYPICFFTLMDTVKVKHHPKMFKLFLLMFGYTWDSLMFLPSFSTWQM